MPFTVCFHSVRFGDEHYSGCIRRHLGRHLGRLNRRVNIERQALGMRPVGGFGLVDAVLIRVIPAFDLLVEKSLL